MSTLPLRGGENLFLLRGGTKAAKHLDTNRKGGEAALEGFEMLEGEDGGGRQHGNLLGVGDSFEGGAHGHFGLAVAVSERHGKRHAWTPCLCGDVGYGKTEVAMRAAFKAVADSKQVAVLAPTTVLAFQHFETFKRRFLRLSVRIEMLSRFRTAAEQKQNSPALEAGKVDIVIGTHRLLPKMSASRISA